MVQVLDQESFKEKVFDYANNKEWKFIGEKPAVIDFYADWCQPCKTVAPVVEQLSNELGDKVDFYKLNVDENQQLAGMFQIQSIPSMLFIPTEGMPQMAVGAAPKTDLEQAISDVLGVEKEESKIITPPGSGKIITP